MHTLYKLTTPLVNFAMNSFDASLKEVETLSRQVMGKMHLMRENIKGDDHLKFTTFVISNLIFFKLSNGCFNFIDHWTEKKSVKLNQTIKHIVLDGILFGSVTALCNLLFFKIIQSPVNSVVLGGITAVHVAFRFLSQQKASFEKEVKNQKKAFDEVEKHSLSQTEKIHVLENEVAQLNQNLRQIKNEAASSAKALQKSLKMAEEYIGEADSLKLENETITLENQELQKTIIQLETAISQYQAEIKDLKQDLEKIEEVLVAKSQGLDECEKKIGELNQLLNKEKNKVTELNAEVNRQKDRNQELVKKIETPIKIDHKKDTQKREEKQRALKLKLEEIKKQIQSSSTPQEMIPTEESQKRKEFIKNLRGAFDKAFNSDKSIELKTEKKSEPKGFPNDDDFDDFDQEDSDLENSPPNSKKIPKASVILTPEYNKI
ncbi:MAG: hypothetical protein ACH350_04360 [Parachlamydiaceae bacterium]